MTDLLVSSSWTQQLSPSVHANPIGQEVDAAMQRARDARTQQKTERALRLLDDVDFGPSAG